MVAGVIGAVGNNDIGVAGVIWDVQLMDVKINSATNRSTLTDVIAGAEYAVNNGARITNNSYRVDRADQAQPLCDVIAAAAADRGVIFVAAAGNEAVNIDVEDNPDSLVPHDALPPADFPPAECPSANVVTVAATTHKDELTEFSNYGANSVDRGAPGEYIVSTFSRLRDPDSRGLGTIFDDDLL